MNMIEAWHDLIYFLWIVIKWYEIKFILSIGINGFNGNMEKCVQDYFIEFREIDLWQTNFKYSHVYDYEDDLMSC